MVRLLLAVFLFISSSALAQSDEGLELAATYQVIHAEGIIRTIDITLVGIDNLFSGEEVNSINDLIIHNSLNRLVKRVPGLRAIFTTDVSGMLKHDSFRYPTRRIDLKERDYIRKALGLSEDSLYIGKPIKNPFFGFDSLPVARPIFSLKGYIKGVATAILAPDDLLQREKICEKCVASIYKLDGQKIVSFPSNLVAQPDILNFMEKSPPNQIQNVTIGKLPTRSLWLKLPNYDLVLLYSYFE